MSRYKPGSGIAKMWEAYESGGAAASIAAGKALGLAAATVKTRVEGWERERKKGGPPVKVEKPNRVAAAADPVIDAKIEPEKPMTKERLLGILKDSKERGADTFYCGRWLPEAQQLVKLGYAVENKNYKNAFTITKAGLKHKSTGVTNGSKSRERG